MKNNKNTFICSVSGIFLITFLLSIDSANAVIWKKVIDYGDPGYSETTHNWETYVYPQAPGGGYRYLSRLLGDHTRTGTVEWKTTIPYCGLYKVQVSCRKTENRTTDADYYFTNSTGGENHLSINQVNHHNVMDWDTLGHFYYAEGQVVRVLLDGTDDGASDCADTASWELIRQVNCISPSITTYTGAPPPPPVVAPQNQLLLNRRP